MRWHGLRHLPSDTARARGREAPRPPWRATKRAWWFEYAAYLPGIVAFIFHPRAPATIWPLIISAAVAYPVFWAIGVFIMVVSRRGKPAGGQPLPPCAADREPGPPPAGQAQPAGFFHAEQVIGALRAALAQGRLTEEEHDTRAAQVSASRTRAEMAPLTADLTADLGVRLPTVRDARTGACVSFAAASVLAAFLLWQPNNAPAFFLAIVAAVTMLVAPPVTVGLMVDARHQKRTDGQLRLGTTPSAGE